MRVLVVLFVIVIVLVIVTWKSKPTPSSTGTELPTGTELGKIGWIKDPRWRIVNNNFVMLQQNNVVAQEISSYVNLSKQ